MCITGGAGFIGGHLAEALLNIGASVTIIDDLSNSSHDLPAKLIDAHPGRARFVYASILDRRGLSDAVLGSDLVFHLAAMGSVPRSIREPERTMEVNLFGTLRVAEACRDAGVKRWVYSASSSAYGQDPPGSDGGRAPRVETMSPRPLSPYAVSKLASEYVVRAWAVCYGLPGISLRYFNVFGPRQPADSAYAAVIPLFFSKLTSGGQPTVYGDGLQTRDFTPVANAVYANLLAGAMEREPRGEVVNIACGRKMSLLELIDRMAKLTDRHDVAPKFEPERTGDILHSLADISRAAQVLGYEPIQSVEEGLQETLEWTLKRRGMADAGPGPAVR